MIHYCGKEEVKQMGDSILLSVKKMIGLDPSYDVFDLDIITYINSVLVVLSQIGLNKGTIKSISGDEETWEDLLGEDHEDLNTVKTYVYMKVRLMFDPPASSVIVDSINKTISELEWRIYSTVDNYDTMGENK